MIYIYKKRNTNQRCQREVSLRGKLDQSFDVMTSKLDFLTPIILSVSVGKKTPQKTSTHKKVPRCLEVRIEKNAFIDPTKGVNLHNYTSGIAQKDGKLY